MSEIQLGNNYVVEETAQDELLIKDTTKGALFRYDRVADQITAVKPYTDITSDDITTTAQLIAPRYDETSQAPSLEGMLIVVPSSGTDTAGAYVHDGTGYTLLDESGGASAGSLSGLSIDTDKDFGGFALSGMGHDGVDVPQVRNLTVADFEAGTLPDAYTIDTGSFTVQSSVVNTGDFALEGQTSSSGTRRFILSLSGLSTYPQRGDSFSGSIQLTDSEDVSRLLWCVQNTSTRPNFGGYVVILSSTADEFFLLKDEGESFTTLDSTPVAFSNYLNEWLKVSVHFSQSGAIDVELSDSTGSTIQTLSASDSAFDAGGVGYSVNTPNSTTATVYFDSFTVERRVGEYYSNTQNGETQLGNRVTGTGGAEIGPHESILTDTTVHGYLRSDDALSAGDPVKLVEWDAGIGGRSLKANADGEGGVYALRNPLAEQITRALSFRENNSFSDVAYTFNDGGTSQTASLAGFPRRLELSHDGSGAGTFAGIAGEIPTTTQSLGAFRITFRGTALTNNSDENLARVGISDLSPIDQDATANGNGLLFITEADGDEKFAVVDGGTVSTTTTLSAGSVTNKSDLVIEFDGSSVTALVDGGVVATASQAFSTDFVPLLQLEDSTASSAGETLEVQDITVEEL